MKYDVVVVGAGPAGSTAAKFLAEKGVKTLLVDRERFPRWKPCAGGLCPHVESVSPKGLFSQTGLVKSMCRSYTTFSPSKRFHWEYLSETPVFYNVDRKEFDQWLMQHALDAGAVFLDNTRITKVRVSPSEAVVETKGGETLNCEAVVGAGGVNCPVAGFLRRKKGVEGVWRRNIGVSIVEELRVDERFIEDVYGEKKKALVYLKHEGLTGYAWVFSKKNTVNVGFAGFHSEVKKKSIKKMFHGFLLYLKKQGFLPKEAESKGMKGALLPYRGPVDETYMDRILLVGDAAGFVSPLTGEGIYYAMDSGKMAAETLVSSFETNRFSSKTLGEYQRMWMRKWGRDLKVLLLFRAGLMKWGEHIVSLGMRDQRLLRLYAGLVNGELKPNEVKWRLLRRLVFTSFFSPHVVFSKNI